MRRKRSKAPSYQPLLADPLWYKDAVIYELRTRSYYDSNGDGIGDLAGLAEKLPYLQDLGITAVWLLPLCPSPGRDDGYDIADYQDVHPDVGTVQDFKRFVAAAHAHGIRVITELVLNHTSDAHAWFQRARRAPAGSVERDFYVWTDNPDKYKEARIIFKDFEPSNWSWDRVANAYYWHRFFSHQPDLNFESPHVQEALLAVCDWWLGEMGVDGLRLDAVPYLYEEEGSNCENLPKTHAFLKKLRSHIDTKFEGKMLLAEANQWPEDAAAYFGDGDECHMNFHFPIMPRMFMAIHMEDRFPIMDILAQTPEVHPTCQWALFLRNHDELTLEMVTDEERDYMYRAYANDTTMRINLGIRVFDFALKTQMTIGRLHGWNQNIQNGVFNELLRPYLHRFFFGTPHHINGLFDQVAHHAFHVATHVANFGKLRGFDFNKGCIGNFGEPTGNFCLADARCPDHQNVVRRDFALHIGCAVHPAPAVTEGNRYVTLSVVLSNNILVKFGNDLPGSKVFK